MLLRHISVLRNIQYVNVIFKVKLKKKIIYSLNFSFMENKYIYWTENDPI